MGFYAIGKRGHHRVAISGLVAASLFFYSWWNPTYLGLILASILFNYATGVALSNSKQFLRKRVLLIGIAGNLGLIGYFKYVNFFVNELNSIRGWGKHLLFLGSNPKALCWGLRKADRGWSTSPAYNLAMGATNIYEIMRFFQHAHAVEPLEQVVVGLDFFQFNAFYQGGIIGLNEEILAADANGKSVSTLTRTMQILPFIGSMEWFINNLKTPIKQNIEKKFLENGFHNPKVLLTSLRNDQCHRKGFMWGFLFPVPKRLYDFKNKKPGVSTFSYYHRILETSQRDGVDLRLLISQSHARQCEAVDTSGLWDKLEEWKQELVMLNEQVASEYNSEPFLLWDFSGYHTYSTEEVPSLDDVETEMKWYIKSSHYQKELGDRALDRIFNYSDSYRTIADDFGTKLATSNIDAHLEKIREDQKRYRETHPEEIEEIKQLYAGNLQP